MLGHLKNSASANAASALCGHRRIGFDTNKRIVWCRDCSAKIDAFDAFVSLSKEFEQLLQVACQLDLKDRGKLVAAE